MKKNLQLKKETRTTYRNIGETARRVKVSREHLSRVLHGKKKGSKRLLSALENIGVEPESAR